MASHLPPEYFGIKKSSWWTQPSTRPDQQTDKTSAFIEVLTLTDDQLISAFDFQHLAATYPLKSYGSSKGGLCLTLPLYFGLAFV